MKHEHIAIRIEQCLSLAKASHCPRRKLAAMLIDPKRNVVLADGYNGGPRGASGKLCKGFFCERDGFQRDLVRIEKGSRHSFRKLSSAVSVPEIQVHYGASHRVQAFSLNSQRVSGPFGYAKPQDKPPPVKNTASAESQAGSWVDQMVESNPAIESGTRMERGCHHAEMNVICNAAAGGINCTGAWLIVLAEPCMMCAKMIHHAGITKVILVDGGYLGGKDGVDYLRDNGIDVQEIEGPKDPRGEC